MLNLQAMIARIEGWFMKGEKGLLRRANGNKDANARVKHMTDETTIMHVNQLAVNGYNKKKVKCRRCNVSQIK